MFVSRGRVGHSLPKCLFYRVTHALPAHLTALSLSRPKMYNNKNSAISGNVVCRVVAIGHCTDMQSDATNGQMDRRGAVDGRNGRGWCGAYAKFVQGETNRNLPTHARLIFHAGNVTGDLCLLSSGPLFHPQVGRGLAFGTDTVHAHQIERDLSDLSLHFGFPFHGRGARRVTR